MTVRALSQPEETAARRSPASLGGSRRQSDKRAGHLGRSVSGLDEASCEPQAGADRLLRLGTYMQTLASLIWLPQAGLIAYAIQAIAQGSGLGAIGVPAAGVFVLGVARALLDASGSRLAFVSARRTLSTIRTKVMAALVTRSPLDTGRPTSGHAASTVTEQAETIVPYLSRYTTARFRAAVVPLAMICAVLCLSWAAALVLLATLPLIPVFMALVGWRAQAASAAQLVETGGMNGFLLDRLRGLATIRALGAVDLTALRLRASAQSLKARTMAVLGIAFLSSAVLELFSALGVAMVAVYVGFHLLGQLPFGTWSGPLSLGQGFFILLLAPACFEPLRDLAAVWHDRAAGLAAFAALDRLGEAGMALPGAGQPEAERRPASDAPPELRISGLGFRHAGAAIDAVDGFDLIVAPGERVALLGPSGSGKSTILALVAGLAPASRGRIAVDGVPLTNASVAGLRSRIAWVGQRPHFMAASLSANIMFGRDWIDEDAMAGALQATTLGSFAGDGSRRVGEGGSGLSGGEALRLALARAGADRHADLLIADEPTAHLDAATAAEVTDGLLAIADRRTVIVATHDPVLASRMDRVVRLEARP